MHKPEIVLHPDASRAIDRWLGTFQLSLISDGPPVTQRNKVEVLGLSSRLRPVILTDQWGEEFRKPHLRPFEHLQDTTTCQGSQCVYIADNRLKDFVAPNLLGWRSICVERMDGIYVGMPTPSGGEPEIQASSLDEITLDNR
jgi:putative hydrolase of the HAD superfamily